MKTRLTFLLSCLIGGMLTACGQANIPSEEDMGAYLFVFFSDPTHSLFMATSHDGYTFTAVNDGKPVIDGYNIAEQRGIRDPHISRGPDGAFYLCMTDLHVFGRQRRIRETQWDRDEAAYGWGNNRGFVLMKSFDLINWTRSNVRIDLAFPETFGNIGCSWAPETIYDPVEGKMMIYFTMRVGNGKTKLYYAYTDDDFTKLVTEPRLLFDYPDQDIQVLDADITAMPDGRYCMMYVAQENPGGIRIAMSDRINGGYVYEDRWVDLEPGACEAPNVWKRIGEDRWVLMYDVFSVRPHNFGFVETTDFVNFTDLKHFNKGEMKAVNFQSPKHGSVIQITREEAERIEEYFKTADSINETVTPVSYPSAVAPYGFRAEGNPLIRHKHTCDPAVWVEGDTLWLYTGHDFAGNQNYYKLKDWCVFSTTDMVNWTEYPTPLKVSEFTWDRTDAAYAAHTVKRNGKYYWYISTNGSGIGVAVSDRPEGPFKDALGKPLLTNRDCFGARHSWVCIDPAVFIDDDGQAYIFWGNQLCYYAKLKENMIEIDGEIRRIDFENFNFTEAPWVHKHKGKYYLTYATGWPEKIAYAMADEIGGPYEYKGIISEIAGNSNTTHPAIVGFKGKWYFFTHNGGLHEGTSYSRSVCVEHLQYNRDGSIRKIHPTTEGVLGKPESR